MVDVLIDVWLKVDILIDVWLMFDVLIDVWLMVDILIDVLIYWLIFDWCVANVWSTYQSTHQP